MTSKVIDFGVLGDWKANALNRIYCDRGCLTRSIDLETDTYETSKRALVHFRDDMDMCLVDGFLTPCINCKAKFSIVDCDCYPFVCIDCISSQQQQTFYDECDEYDEQKPCIDCGDYECEGNGACGMYRGFGIPPEPCDCCMRTRCVCSLYDSGYDTEDSYERKMY